MHAYIPNTHTHTLAQMRTHARTSVPTLHGCAGGARWRCVCTGAIRRRETPLHEAAYKGHADVNNGNADVAAALLAHGADVHAKDSEGCGGRPGRSDARTRMPAW
jgi:hypothetical protein